MLYLLGVFIIARIEKKAGDQIEKRADLAEAYVKALAYLGPAEASCPCTALNQGHKFGDGTKIWAL